MCKNIYESVMQGCVKQYYPIMQGCVRMSKEIYKPVLQWHLNISMNQSYKDVYGIYESFIQVCVRRSMN